MLNTQAEDFNEMNAKSFYCKCEFEKEVTDTAKEKAQDNAATLHESKKNGTTNKTTLQTHFRCN